MFSSVFSLSLKSDLPIVLRNMTTCSSRSEDIEKMLNRLEVNMTNRLLTVTMFSSLSMYSPSQSVSQINRVAEETRNICYCGGIAVVHQPYSLSCHREGLALGVFIS